MTAGAIAATVLGPAVAIGAAVLVVRRSALPPTRGWRVVDALTLAAAAAVFSAGLLGVAAPFATLR